MSTFNGCIEELENILVDNFVSDGSHTCFFLSHCHSDHMNGIKQLLSSIRKKSNQFLYCSAISRLILLNKFGSLNESAIRDLATTSVITVPESNESPGYDITVTPIPAGHCPGSIMFLFEGIKNTIFYTGDFRISKGDIKKFKSLHRNGEVKKIHKVYFDSTFLNEMYWEFPLRTKVCDDITNVVRNWLNKSMKHKVFIETSAVYGYEYVLVELAKQLKTKIHVKDSVYDLYWNVPEVGSFLTKDCKSTKIHSFCSFEKKCSYFNCEWFKIKLSAQWFKSTVNNFKITNWKMVSDKKLVMCFATHCSCSELVDFLNYLHPDEVTPCCNAIGCSEEEMNSYIKQLIWSWPRRKRERSPDSDEESLVLERNYKFKIKIPSIDKDSEEYKLKQEEEENFWS